MSLLLLLVLSVSFSSQAQDLDLDENKFLGYIYQQQGYLTDDPKGDILLLWTATQIPASILNNLRGREKEIKLQQFRREKLASLLLKYPEYVPKEETSNLVIETYIPQDMEDEAIELEGHKAPFKVKNVVSMMKQVIAEENAAGISPQEGVIHEWSPTLKKKLHRKFTIFSHITKLLLSLSRGVTSYYMVTGTEDELKNYILARPEKSINLEEMFRASFRLNKGDVYLTLLTIENVLSRFWMSPDREKRAITTKLKDITNYNYYTDKFGAWYHLFGIMLYGYAEGGLKAKMVGNVESVGSKIMGRFADERQETYINNRGGPVGARIRRFVKNKEFESFEMDKKYVNEEFYMDLDEDFSRRLKKARTSSKSERPEYSEQN